MRDVPPRPGDPYATLGLGPGASMAEVKRAYRRLAKAYHPDSAGEPALPRFLAIHEAYEAIRTGRPMVRGRGAAAGPGAGTRPAAPQEPWRADPSRARAARERAARAGRGAGAGRAAGSEGAAGAGGSAGAATGSGGASTGSSSAGAAGPAGRGRPGGRRTVRKATLGSTSYDEARDPNDASWSGASWYGPSTGEYWIINPREYADPRKHGPEYQSRARRPLAGELPGDTVGGGDDPGAAAAAGFDRDAAAGPDDATWTVDAGGAARTGSTGRAEPLGREDRPRRGQWAARSTAGPDIAAPDDDNAGQATATAPPAGSAGSAAAPRGRPTGPSGTTASGEGPASAAGPGWATAWPADGRSLRRARSGGGGGTRRVAGALAGTPRDWIAGAPEDPIRRLGVALVAWPPVGLAAAAVIGDVTGCSAYSADCGGTEPLLPWLAQAAILGLLLLLPPVARLLAGGSIGVLFALVPLTAVLVAVGGAGAPQAGFALAFLLAIAWLVGVTWAAWQQARSGPARAAP